MRPASDGLRQPRSLSQPKLSSSKHLQLGSLNRSSSASVMMLFGLNSPKVQRPSVSCSWLEIRNPHLDYLTAFFETNNGEVKQLGQVQGDDLPFTQRSILLRHFVFSLPVAQYDITKLWLRVNSTTARSVPIYLSNKISSLSICRKRTLADGVFVGLVLVLGIYSLLALAGKRRNLVGSYLVFC